MAEIIFLNNMFENDNSKKDVTVCDKTSRMILGTSYSHPHNGRMQKEWKNVLSCSKDHYSYLHKKKVCNSALSLGFLARYLSPCSLFYKMEIAR